MHLDRSAVFAIAFPFEPAVNPWDGAPSELGEVKMASPPAVVAQEIQIVDEQGRVRMTLSARSGNPTIEWLDADLRSSVVITLDDAGRPSVRLGNPNANGPVSVLEIDANGAHVKFDRPGGASSYLFLNNSGGSGVVLTDYKGVRRLEALVAADGSPTFGRFGPDGKALV
jgi:hypothetical protein